MKNKHLHAKYRTNKSLPKHVHQPDEMPQTIPNISAGNYSPRRDWNIWKTTFNSENYFIIFSFAHKVH